MYLNVPNLTHLSDDRAPQYHCAFSFSHSQTVFTYPVMNPAFIVFYFISVISFPLM